MEIIKIFIALKICIASINKCNEIKKGVYTRHNELFNREIFFTSQNQKNNYISFLVALTSDDDFVYCNSDIKRKPSHSIRHVFAIFTKNSYFIQKSGSYDSFKIYIPIQPIKKYIYITDKPYVVHHSYKSHESLKPQCSSILKLFNKKNQKDVNTEIEVKFHFKFEKQKKIYDEKIMPLLNSCLNILKTYKIRNEASVIELKRQWEYFKKDGDKLNPIKKRLKEIFKYYAFTPKYHFLIKIKIILTLISHIQEKDISYLEYDKNLNFFYLFDKFFNKYETTETIDTSILNDILNIVGILDLNDAYFNRIVSRKLIYELRFFFGFEKKFKYNEIVKNLKYIKQSDEYINIYMNADVYNMENLINEFSEFEGFHFLMTISEMMFAYNYLEIENKYKNTTYCHMYDKLYDSPCIKFEHLINFVEKIPEIPEIENIYNKKLKEINNTNDSVILNIYNCVEIMRKQVFMFSAIDGVFFYEFTDNLFSFMLKVLRNQIKTFSNMENIKFKNKDEKYQF
ncbi:hypothetical protein TCON_0934 [Astathelohania contejeani]|uniref:Uncharacterized protein n=1 Tax=Astathelohania contejeani TaxID=164912 RepID=A0ABQ7I0C8_9MICR|nr:hypothetical protein TCON_0934 [Thelohania contejeani]